MFFYFFYKIQYFYERLKLYKNIINNEKKLTVLDVKIINSEKNITSKWYMFVAFKTEKYFQ